MRMWCYIKIPLSFSNEDGLVKRTDAAGLQRERVKKTIEVTAPGCFEIFTHNGMEATMGVKPGQLDCYIDVCNTDADAALLIAVTVIGYNRGYTITKPDIKAKGKHIAKMTAKGKMAFDLSVEHIEHAAPVLTNRLK